jgi:hypothetical protein
MALLLKAQRAAAATARTPQEGEKKLSRLNVTTALKRHRQNTTISTSQFDVLKKLVFSNLDSAIEKLGQLEDACELL